MAKTKSFSRFHSESDFKKITFHFDSVYEKNKKDATFR